VAAPEVTELDPSAAGVEVERRRIAVERPVRRIEDDLGQFL